MNKWQQLRIFLIFSIFLMSCKHRQSAALRAEGDESLAASDSTSRIMGYWEIPKNSVVAHRGASYDAPESTEISFILARELGAEYLEADLQRTLDGELIVLHDINLKRTTNIADVFPDRIDSPASQFTLAEIKTLDAGSWFNKVFPSRRRDSFVNAKILTLDEFINIAQGKRANGQHDPKSLGHLPGIYLETKEPALFPGIEFDLFKKLLSRGLLSTDIGNRSDNQGPSRSQLVTVGKGRSKVVLQTFQPASLVQLKKHMPNVPKVFLLWLYAEDRNFNQDDRGVDLSKTYGPLLSPIEKIPGELDSQYFGRTAVKSQDNFKKWITWAKENGADCTGPSAKLAGWNDPVKGFESYFDLLLPWMNQFTHETGMCIHAYSLDEIEDLEMAKEKGVDGVITNRPEVALDFFGRTSTNSIEAISRQYGF